MINRTTVVNIQEIYRINVKRIKIKNETLLFHVKSVRGNKKFYRQIVSKGRGNRTIEVAFWVISISRPVAEIYGLEVHVTFNVGRKL